MCNTNSDKIDGASSTISSIDKIIAMIMRQEYSIPSIMIIIKLKKMQTQSKNC